MNEEYLKRQKLNRVELPFHPINVFTPGPHTTPSTWDRVKATTGWKPKGVK